MSGHLGATAIENNGISHEKQGQSRFAPFWLVNVWTVNLEFHRSPAIYVKDLAYVRSEDIRIGSNWGHLISVFYLLFQIHGNRG